MSLWSLCFNLDVNKPVPPVLAGFLYSQESHMSHNNHVKSKLQGALASAVAFTLIAFMTLFLIRGCEHVPSPVAPAAEVKGQKGS